MSNRSLVRLCIPVPAVAVLLSVGCLATDQDQGNGGTQIDTVTFKSVSVGGGHSCGIVVGDYAYCWGDNTFGQLGAADQLNHSVPQFVQGGPLEFRQISAGGTVTCAITADQDAYCWGQNEWGQVGIGAVTAPVLAPNKVLGGHQFTFVTSGAVHICGLVNAGEAWCWGLAGAGQLGNGQSGSETPVPLPVAVVGGHQFKELSAGTLHTCGVTTSGEAYCWGRGTNGELGDGAEANSTTPVRVSGDILFGFIDAGDDHTCAVDLEGNAHCWGAGGNGQLGTGARTSSTVPVAVTGAVAFTAISAGNNYSCGVDASAKVYCWGINAAGEIGDGTGELRTGPTPVTGNLEFRTISAGQSAITAATCGFATNNRVYCWGEGLLGQLGTGNLSSSRVPVEVVGQR